MNPSTPPTSPNDPQRRAAQPADSVARRRRARRQMFPASAEGRAAIVAGLARRAYPTYEYFIFALLSGAVLGLGFLLDSPPVLLFGILLAPLMTPWVGMVLGMITGSTRFFLETLVATLITALLVFLCGLLSGLASRAFGPMTFNNAFYHSQLWIAWLVVLAAGSALLVISFVRSEEKPFLPSVMLAYSLFTPVSAAGFGLGSNVDGMWPNGVLVFAVHLATATLIGLITFLVLKFRPTTTGYVLSGVSTVVILALLVILMLPGIGQQERTAQVIPTQAPGLEPSPEMVAVPAAATDEPAAGPSATPRVNTATPFTASPLELTPQVTLPPSQTPTITLTIEPTPVYARISSDTGGGVNLRKGPNGQYIATLDNGSIVEVLPEVQEVSFTTWAHVIATRNGQRLEGWILQSVLVTATPVPNWEPSATSPASTAASVTATATGFETPAP